MTDVQTEFTPSDEEAVHSPSSAADSDLESAPAADLDREGDIAADYIEELLDILFDDFIGYLATIGAPALRLLAMPDPTRDYYHPEWKTDGSEGNFGRRRKALL